MTKTSYRGTGKRRQCLAEIRSGTHSGVSLWRQALSGNSFGLPRYRLWNGNFGNVRCRVYPTYNVYRVGAWGKAYRVSGHCMHI